MKVKKMETKRGLIYRFEDTGTCCWKSGSREFRVVLDKDQHRITVRLLKATNLSNRDELTDSYAWDESRESCYGDQMRDFTRECLDWIWDNVLDPKKGFFSAIEVFSGAEGKYKPEVMERWEQRARESLELPCSEKLFLKDKATKKDQKRVSDAKREDVKKGAKLIDSEINLLRLCGYEVPLICEGNDPTKFYWLLPDGRRVLNDFRKVDFD